MYLDNTTTESIKFDLNNNVLFQFSFHCTSFFPSADYQQLPLKQLKACHLQNCSNSDCSAAALSQNRTQVYRYITALQTISQSMQKAAHHVATIKYGNYYNIKRITHPIVLRPQQRVYNISTIQKQNTIW